MKNIILIFCCLNTILAFSQAEKNNWYFGNRAALSFDNGNALVKYDNPRNITGASASISHPVTGKLLLYTNGINVWNGLHQVIANGNNITTGPIGDVLLVPYPGKPLQYHLFLTQSNSLKHTVVDMNANVGAGAVIFNLELIENNRMSQFAALHHPYEKSFWLVSYDKNTNSFCVNKFDSSGMNIGTMHFAIGLVPELYGDMVFNNAGTKFAVTHYQGNDFQVEVFDFDPVCGYVSNPQRLAKETSWDRAYGAAFSADDSKLYITYSYQESQLVQYSGSNFQQSNLIAGSADNLNIIRLGKDRRMYIATHDVGIPGPRIDVVLQPDSSGNKCQYRKTFLTTNDGTGRNAYFELPAFASGKAYTASPQDSIIIIKGGCLGQTSQFSFKPDYAVDSVLWDFGDGSVKSKNTTALHTYQTAAKYVVSLTLYRCYKSFKVVDTLRIVNPLVIDFPKDTLLCPGVSLTLNAPQADNYKWSTNEKTQSIVITKPGWVWLEAKVGSCAVSDSINVLYVPDILTMLGDEYFICDDDKELVKLDAGNEFVQYKWTPTGDTSQWIIVGNVADYFVVVKDYRGCIGNDGTKVKRRCPVNVFYPNAFTPNGDGINDLYLPVGKDVVDFKLTIYNAWGEEVFKTQNIQYGWDGKVKGISAPIGTYIYRSSYSGFKNKRLVEFESKGNLTLIR